MKKKKLLILGATINQLPLVINARRRNIHTIAVDNIPQNICHKYSDQNANISTVEKKLVLNFAKKNCVDGIITCASDTALPTVAYTCHKLNLPSVSTKSVLTTINKDLFRAFQRKNGLTFPQSHVFTDIRQAISKHYLLSGKKWVIKPTDSSGSKGITLLHKTQKSEYLNAVNKAFSFSRSHKIIMEEYISGTNCSVDGFIKKGTVDILCITNKLITPYPGLTPVGHTLPSKLLPDTQKAIKKEIENTLNLLDVYTSPFDFDIIVTDDGKAVILEMSLRIGGNGIPNLIKHATGYDLYDAAISQALTEAIPDINWKQKPVPAGVFLICSPLSGELASLTPKNKLLAKYPTLLREIVYDYKAGQRVEKFTQGNHRIGHVVLQAKSEKLLSTIFNKIKKDMRITVKSE